MFVERQGGVIVSTYAQRQPGRADEEIEATHPDVVEFKALARRVQPLIGDLISVLHVDQKAALEAVMTARGIDVEGGKGG